MRYAPENELGVVFLPAHMAKRWRLRVMGTWYHHLTFLE
jgi:hypothetical protein